MDVSRATSESRLIEQFLSALRTVPETLAEWRPEPLVLQGWPADARIDLCVAGRAADLFVEVRKSLYPRDVRETLWRLKDLVRTAPQAASRELVPVLVAESISPGAQELLRQERVGYYDSGGSLFLPARGLYVHVDRPPPKRFARSVRSLFSGRRAQVLRALLGENGGEYRSWFRLRDLVLDASVPATTVSQVLIELERFEWVVSRYGGPKKQRVLQEPEALLDAWVEQLAGMRPLVTHRYYVPLIQPAELVEKLAATFEEHGVTYAITGEAAAQRYAPFLSALSRVHCRLLMGRAAEEAIETLGARSVDEGANLLLVESQFPGELSFRASTENVRLCGRIQVYLDLLRGAGRAKELAEHLRSEVIGF